MGRGSRSEASSATAAIDFLTSCLLFYTKARKQNSTSETLEFHYLDEGQGPKKNISKHNKQFVWTTSESHIYFNLVFFFQYLELKIVAVSNQCKTTFVNAGKNGRH